MAKDETTNVLTDGWDNVEAIDTDLGEIIKLGNIGDVFVGFFRDLMTVTKDTDRGEDEVTAARFWGADGNAVALWANHDLARKLKNVAPKSPVRIEYAEDLDTGQISPMKVYRVQAK